MPILQSMAQARAAYFELLEAHRKAVSLLRVSQEAAMRTLLVSQKAEQAVAVQGLLAAGATVGDIPQSAFIHFSAPTTGIAPVGPTH